MRIAPSPPLADLTLPWDDAQAPDPTTALRAARLRHGDTFAVHSGPDEYLFVFSPAALRAFYTLPESTASKGLADYSMLIRMLPPELFLERRTFPHDLFGAQDVESYLDALDHAVAVSLEELGARGTFDVFDWSRRVGHRLALTAWIGTNASSGAVFEALVECMDVLDGARAFVTPSAMVDHRDYDAEFRALAEMERLVEQLAPAADGFLPEIASRWTDVSDDARARGVARDIVVLHIGTMTNLFAALAWTIAQMVLNGETAATGSRREQCALEAIRLGQYSLISRAILKPCSIDDGTTAWNLEPGALLATMAPLTNRDSSEGLATFDANRWRGRAFTTEPPVDREAIVTFGHGSHRCPATRFSLSAITRTTERLFADFDVHAHFTAVESKHGQIGGMARSEHSCVVAYERRPVHTGSTSPKTLG